MRAPLFSSSFLSVRLLSYLFVGTFWTLLFFRPLDIFLPSCGLIEHLFPFFILHVQPLAPRPVDGLLL